MRRASLICAFLSLIVGWGAIAFDLYGPTYTGSSCSGNSTTSVCTTSTASLVQVGLSVEAAIFLIVMSLLFFGVFLGAMFHFMNRRRLGSILYFCAAFMTLGTFVSGFSIGYSFIPGDLLALATIVFATRIPRSVSPGAKIT